MPAKFYVEAESHVELLKALRELGVKDIAEALPKVEPVSQLYPNPRLSMEIFKTLIGLLYCGKKSAAQSLVKEHFKTTDLDALNFVNQLFNDYFIGVEES